MLSTDYVQFYFSLEFEGGVSHSRREQFDPQGGSCLTRRSRSPKGKKVSRRCQVENDFHGGVTRHASGMISPFRRNCPGIAGSPVHLLERRSVEFRFLTAPLRMLAWSLLSALRRLASKMSEPLCRALFSSHPRSGWKQIEERTRFLLDDSAASSEARWFSGKRERERIENASPVLTTGHGYDTFANASEFRVTSQVCLSFVSRDRA